MTRRRWRGLSFTDLNRVGLGLAAVAVTVVAVAAVFAVGTFGLLQHRYAMSGVFTDSGGIGRGDAVRVAGVQVGLVTGVHPDFSRGQVIITWDVDSDVQLGPATTAEVALSTLLGGHYLRLAGPVERPFMANLPAAERRIPLARTTTPATISDVLNNTTHALSQLNTTNVNLLLGQLAQITGDNQATVGTLLTNLATVSEAVNERDQQLRALVANTEQITATLASKDQALVSLVDSAGKLLDEIVARRDDLATLLGSGSQAVTTLSNLIADHRAQLDAILGDLHAVIGAAGRQLPQVNTSLAFIGPAFAGVASAGQQGPWIDVVTYGLPGLDVVNLLRQLTGTGAPG